MEKPEITITPYGEDRYRVYVTLPPVKGVRKTEKQLNIEVDPEFGINVAATGSLDPRDIPIFTEGLGVAKLLKDGILKI